ncbi:MAG: ABC transporter ATP-binding protein [Spirochaetes bacterium]|nr:ABC transporter ATP-binding protein [Spirochaetota bacterium]
MRTQSVTVNSNTAQSVPSLLSIENLGLIFQSADRRVHALRSMSLSIAHSEILALVGESGSGKSVTGLSLLRLHGKNAALSGKIFYNGKNLLELSEEEMRVYRGRELAMIFQEPMTALNPVFSVGFQMKEVLMLHAGLTAKNAETRATELMSQVGIPEAALRLKAYPFQLSGGMRQRVLIAIALAAKPKILIADEPTTALDVTIQAQILRLLREVNERESMAMLFITHDLGIVAKLAHRVAVMYAGEIVETGSVAEIFSAPRHPYTQALLASKQTAPRGEKLFAIPGTPPLMNELPQGCAFAQRCAYAEARCHETIPKQNDGAHVWRCIRR